MSFTPSALARFIADRIDDAPNARALLEACETEGFTLDAACHVLTDPWEHFVARDAAEVEENLRWHWGDLLLVLVESFGLGRAGEIAAATDVWRDVDVAAYHAGHLACLAAEAAITDEVPIRKAFELATDTKVPPARKAGLLDRLARVYPAAEVAGLADAVSPRQAATLGGVLQRQLSPLAAFDELLGAVEPEVVLLALERFWDVRVDEGATEDVLLATYARLAREELQPLDAIRRFAIARGEPTWWVPILRGEGLKASHAALWLLEAGTSTLGVAELLGRGGYADPEVLAALLENGVGTRASLAILRESGWSAATMVESLAARGMLLPEIRARLEDLGVPREAQRPLLRRCGEASMIDLVLEPLGATKALPRGGGDDGN